MNTVVPIVLPFVIGYILALVLVKLRIKSKPAIEVDGGLSVKYLGKKASGDNRDVYVVKTDGRPLDSWLIQK